MSTTLRLSGLRGALLLARGEAAGLHRMPDDPRAATRSFWAAAACLPLFAALVMLNWRMQPGGEGWPADLPLAAARQALIFTVGWAGYAVISHRMLHALGIGARWPRFIAVWNWVNVVQYALLLAAALPTAAGAPALIAETTLLVAQGWALWLEWYAIRVALDASRARAALIMAPDVILGILLTALV